MIEDNKKILNKLLENGYEAYFVGGCVRDYILNKTTNDIDIATNAKPNEIIKLFENSDDNSYGGVTFTRNNYIYEITTYRKEIKYKNRKPIEFIYVDTIEEDILRRDFTINALYMDVNNNIIDLCDGIKDINNKIIRPIGDINIKLVEDPLRMLRAIRFKTIYNFDIEENLLNYIKENKELITSLSYTRRKEELDLIIKSDNRINGLKYIKELGLEDVLDISIPDNLYDSTFPLCMYAQINFSDNYSFTKNELNIINDIKTIVNYGIIDNIILYKYGLYECQLAGDLLNISDAYISDLYKNLPIYSTKDINIKVDDILDILNIKPGGIIKDVLDDIELNILENKLTNTKEELEKYIIDNWR